MIIYPLRVKTAPGVSTPLVGTDKANTCSLYIVMPQGEWYFQVMNLSPNFTIRELTHSQAAERRGLRNYPTPEALENLRALCLVILEPILSDVGRLHVSSGYRGQELNSIIGGSLKSQHCQGQAADLECYSLSTIELAKRVIGLGLPFDQLIVEFADKKNPDAGWVHVSYQRPGINGISKNRGQILSAIKGSQGKISYVQGLV